MSDKDKAKDTKKEVIIKTKNDQLTLPTVTPDGVKAISKWCDDEKQKPFLKYNKGEFLYGMDAEVLPLGTRLVPDMASLAVGQIKWSDSGEVVEQRIGLVADCAAVRREDVGDHDEDLWPRDEDGKRSDPWSPVRNLPMKDPNTGTEFVFTTSSGGGNQALVRFTGQWRRQYTDNPGKLPVMEIGSDSYPHRTYGKVHFPVFRLVSWETEEDLKNGKESDAAAFLDDEIPDLTGDKS